MLQCRQKMGLKLHKRHLIWARKRKRGDIVYFDIEEWNFVEYLGEWQDEDFIDVEKVIGGYKMDDSSG